MNRLGNVGDYIGMIHKDCSNQYRLLEGKIKRISENSRGTKYYCNNTFNPLNAEVVDSNTNDMQSDTNFVIVEECFILNDVTRPRSERWIEWANNNPEKIKNWYED